ncbi:hypothetical protein KFK09_004612 [Dendrobium nobile]|uniref:Uncharacterized protein n=1 Tax=Dendrobium nobile TaxID=94219 RepID=A0A8T3C153_DENNO|nr:hypothetical protein KFK09_004612 [Dendrobium nobile]
MRSDLPRKRKESRWSSPGRSRNSNVGEEGCQRQCLCGFVMNGRWLDLLRRLKNLGKTKIAERKLEAVAEKGMAFSPSHPTDNCRHD